MTLVRDIYVTKQHWERAHKKQQAPALEGVNDSIRLIDKETNEIIAIQILIGDELETEQRSLVRWLRFGMKWDDSTINMKMKTNKTDGAKGQGRLSGIRYPSRVFGFSAPKPLRRRWACSPTLLTRDYPELADILDKFTKLNWEMFMKYAPEQAAQHKQMIDEQIKDDWKIAKLPFTSGVINNTAALPYHRDSGNVAGSWSAMLALRKGVEGGALHLPEYDFTFGIPNGSITLFDGQGTWHGVTPLVRAKNDGYRFTLVWYAIKEMCKCLSMEEEATEAKKRATR